MLKLIFSYINDFYGSKRGLRNYFCYRFLTLLGFYARYKRIDWGRVERIVFVCHGNICRSPLAGVCAKDAGAESESFGLDCTSGCSADGRAIAYAKQLGVDLESHRTRVIGDYSASSSDLIVVMEPAHMKELSSDVVSLAQVTLSGLWAGKPCAYIHDPYGSNLKFFSRCEDFVVESVLSLVKRVGCDG